MNDNGVFQRHFLSAMTEALGNGSERQDSRSDFVLIFYLSGPQFLHHIVTLLQEITGKSFFWFWFLALLFLLLILIVAAIKTCKKLKWEEGPY